jgi:hypothetical protein
MRLTGFDAPSVGCYEERAGSDHPGVPRGRLLHVAQSLSHDHVPAAELT